jgi:hypothetical protein
MPPPAKFAQKQTNRATRSAHLPVTTPPQPYNQNDHMQMKGVKEAHNFRISQITSENADFRQALLKPMGNKGR